MKPVKFHPKAKEFVRDLSTPLKKQIGEALRDIQKGLMPTMPLNRPMPSIAKGVYEIRVKDAARKIRVFYMVKIEDFILVFHAFEKKTQKTPRKEIKIAEERSKLLDTI